jgi:N-acetylglucosaminyldiphosphoundecaprenol N-acetyl-beta-D-mannosaminyltransferase
VGLEWLWRIKEEPALWRRYFSDGLKFVSLLATRVAPYAWLISRNKPADENLRQAAVDIHQVGGEVYIRLRGAWCSQNLHVLRQRLSEAAAGARHIRVNLAQVSYVDSAFLGLLLVLYGIQKKQGRRLICGAATPMVRKIFRYGCSEFLLAPDDDAAWDAAATALDEVEAEDAGTNVGR